MSEIIHLIQFIFQEYLNYSLCIDYCLSKSINKIGVMQQASNQFLKLIDKH